MESTDKALDRLLEAASECEPELPACPPYGFESRLFARLRRRRPDGVALFLRHLRIGLACAAAFAVLVTVLSYIHQPATTTSEIDFNASTWTILAND
jgi:hypothetical protein